MKRRSIAAAGFVRRALLDRAAYVDTDCASNACDVAMFACVANQCVDQQQDGSETAVDCGGGTGVRRVRLGRPVTVIQTAAFRAIKSRTHALSASVATVGATAPKRGSIVAALPAHRVEADNRALRIAIAPRGRATRSPCFAWQISVRTTG